MILNELASKNVELTTIILFHAYKPTTWQLRMYGFKKYKNAWF
jgi:hypothetical protein